MRFDLDLFDPFYITFDGAKCRHLASVTPGGTIVSACRMIIFGPRQDTIRCHQDMPIGFETCSACKANKKKFLAKKHPDLDPKRVKI